MNARENHQDEYTSNTQIATIVVASTNPVKIQAALTGFQAMFTDRQFQASGISVPSGVSAQPMTSLETRQGALNRAETARKRNPDAAYWIGIEGGCEENAGEPHLYSWVVLLSRDLAQLG